MGLTLVIGNKNYSSWSLRPWIFLKHLGLPFEEVVIPLYAVGSSDEILKYSAARKVPVLLDGSLRVWDSIAICEYLAERNGRGWPKDQDARATARSISAEMHSGFQNLRAQCPMNARARRQVTPTPELLADIKRIDQIWQDCRQRFGAAGPWLFGEYSIADAMYAPVVLRFNTYGGDLSPIAAQYMRTVLADPPMQEWLSASAAESHKIAATDAVGIDAARA